MLTVDPSLNLFFTLSSKSLSETLQIPLKRATLIYHELHDETYRRLMETSMNKYSITAFLDADYPALLKCIPDPPLVLYLNGDPSLLHTMPSISVIGTRRPSKDAFDTMNHLLPPLIKHGWVIVSGMAVGVDQFAHQLSMRYDGKTIAVIGSGFEHIYPKSNTTLYHRIADSHLVVSEYPPHVKAQRHHFPERNRIISGLTFGTLVIEAKARSGSLITVEQALEQGREVFAVPGSILNPQSEGCHQMIQDGAKLVRNTYDIIENYPEF
ncbi:DNA-processing protein DprA [Thalassobacillus hwangdonensis]|uniref:DNA-processing protein DprA n=2 Tax=Thalassobacillus hwangdonensis TaxID=546108 RepID=A0ABW3KY51_9BACI